MDTKRIHALLLLGIVAAGAMTIGNAYAQTNTERLMQVVSDTSSIIDTLDSIQATMAAALSSMADQIASIAAMVSGVDEKVDDIGSDVSHVVDDVEHLIEDVEMLDSKIAEMMAANEASAAAQAEQVAQSAVVLPQMQATLDSIASNTEKLASADAVAQNTAAISEITQSIGEINAKLDAISTNLNVVQEVVEMPPDPVPSDAAALSPANLQAKSSEFEFTVGTFGDSVLKPADSNTKLQAAPAGSADPLDDYASDPVSLVQYTGAVSFTCTGDVYITSVTTTGTEKIDYDGTTTATPYSEIDAFTTSTNDELLAQINLPHEYGEIESVTVVSPPRDVYYRNFNLQHGQNKYLSDPSLDRSLDMNYYSLEAGQSLDITAVYREFAKTVVEDPTASTGGAVDIVPGYYTADPDADPATMDNVTDYIRPVSVYAGSSFPMKSMIAGAVDPLMTLNVGWTTSESDTKCKFTVTSDAPREMESETQFFSIDGVERGIAYDFNRSVSCFGQKTTITDMVVSIPNLDLYSYATFAVSSNEIGANADQKTEITKWTFNQTGSFMSNADALPYELMPGDELIFEGSVPGVEKLLISITRDTVKGNTCQ